MKASSTDRNIKVKMFGCVEVIVLENSFRKKTDLAEAVFAA